MANSKLVTIEKNDFAAVRERVRAASVEQVRFITEDLKTKSVKLAPVMLGVLRQSAATNYSKNGLRGEVSFNTPYAAAQHERTDQVHPQGGQAKYLEDPLLQNRDVYQSEMAAAIKKAIGS